MASVLLCRDERLGREVAVKRLHADSPADVERRFVREAKLGASLNHPNLVTVFDTCVQDEGVLIVMEYVPGESLAHALRHGPLGPRRVASMVRDLGAALDHAHSQGIVHRDVKPGNVLLRNDGVTKLVDLGIATASESERFTRSGMVLGTAAYMAPEQLDGSDTGPATDIYALAAVCFEALSGRRARDGRTPIEVAHAIASGPPPDLREAWPRAPGAAADVLSRGMARDPAVRPASAGELGRELSKALEEGPATAPTRRFRRTQPLPAPVPAAAETPPPSTPPRGQAPASRRGPRLPAAIAVALLLALAIATLAVALGSGGGDEASRETADGNPPAGKDPAKQKADRPKKEKKEQSDQPAAAAPPEEEPAAPEPLREEPAEQPAEQPSSFDPAQGAALNEEGFDLMNAGRYDEAIPVLQQAVDSFPPGTSDLNYAYALFNLGKSLRLAGRPEEAIPFLEQRLQIPNQTETVQAELDLARRQAQS
jgi:serine/threonine-protein kinase